MKVDIDYQSNPLPNRPSSQDKHLWQKKSHDGVSPHQLRFSSWHSHHLKGLQGVSWGELFALSFLPQLWMGNLTVWVRDRSDVARSGEDPRIGTGKAGPHSSGKGQRISTVRDFRFFLMPWRDKSKSFTCHPASHWSQRVPIFSVWFYITRKNKVCVYTAGGNRPLPSHFLDQCFLCIVANKKNHGWMLFISKWGTVLNSVNSLSILFQVLKQCLSKAFIWETVPNLWTHRSTP